MSFLAPAARRSFTQSTRPYSAAFISAVRPQLLLDVCSSERRLSGAPGRRISRCRRPRSATEGIGRRRRGRSVLRCSARRWSRRSPGRGARSPAPRAGRRRWPRRRCSRLGAEGEQHSASLTVTGQTQKATETPAFRSRYVIPCSVPVFCSLNFLRCAWYQVWLLGTKFGCLVSG
eukprot:s1351_g11.t1